MNVERLSLLEATRTVAVRLKFTLWQKALLQNATAATFHVSGCVPLDSTRSTCQ